MVRLLTVLTLSTFLLMGCGGQEEYREVSDADLEEHPEEEHHHHEAPHGGHLIELGDHLYNAELVFSQESPHLTLYFLGAHAETPLPIANETVEFHLEHEGGEQPLEFKPSAQEGDPEGKASKFVFDGELPEGIDEIEKMHGHLHITIEEVDYEGELEHDHDHEGHDDHDEHDHDEEHKE